MLVSKLIDGSLYVYFLNISTALHLPCCVVILIASLKRFPVMMVKYVSICTNSLCVSCASILSMVQVSFSFVSNSLSYITIPKIKGNTIKTKEKIESEKFSSNY